MSSSAEVYMERERRRRELYLNRIRANVETFLARYETVLADLHAQDLVRYVQAEVSHAETCIGLARRALVSDVEQAQAFSFEVGDLLRGLPSYARSRKRGEATANREAARLAALKEEVQVELCPRDGRPRDGGCAEGAGGAVGRDPGGEGDGGIR